MKSEKTTFEDFKAFCGRHEKFFAKPTVGTGGNGARVIAVDSDSLENLYAVCKEEKMMVEEIVQQHPDLAAFNEGSINTARVITLVCADGVPRILFSVVRFGRKGKNLYDMRNFGQRKKLFGKKARPFRRSANFDRRRTLAGLLRSCGYPFG